MGKVLNLSGQGDLLIAGGLIGIVVMMVLPLPAFLLDILLALNLTFALMILLLTIYMREPLEFSVFPSLLLVATLFRLALNVSSTRLILLNGYAGEIIRKFGEFVVGGNAVVGFVVFCILIVIQFVVITRGAERVAEVAARFTLDAMPGKQMSIDADLNAGLLTEAEARRRRREVEQEADFYGAMDGASKFVKGDAIAGIIITVINLIGGVAVGAAQLGMTAGEALNTYALLTIGDGLVTQIPALLISTAAGICVTRAASDANLGQDLVGQVLSQPRALNVASALLVFFGLVPGLPRLPFFILAAALGALAVTVARVRHEAEGAKEREEAEREREQQRRPENVMPLVQVDPVEIELGYALIGLAAGDERGDLLERVVGIRRQLALERGVVVPPVRIRDNVQLQPTKYVIKLKGVRIADGEILTDHHLAIKPGDDAPEVPGVPTTEPAFGLEAVWVDERHRDQAEVAGYTVVDPASVIATHLMEVIRENIGELLGKQEVKDLLEMIRETHPAVVEELVPEPLSIGEVQRVLQNLLREGLSIRNLVTILEALGDWARVTRDLDMLTEHARQSIKRTISASLGISDGRLAAITLAPDVEQTLRRGLQQDEGGRYLAVEPEVLDRVIRSLRSRVEQMIGRGRQAVALCSPGIRPVLRRLVERVLPRLAVVSYAELEPDISVETVGVVNLDGS